MKHKKYFKYLFLTAGIFVGPVIIAVSLIGLTFNLVHDSMMYAFFYGFTAFVGGFYMLKSASYLDREEIVVDVAPESNGGDD